MSRRNSDSGRMAVAWLATAFVIVFGAGASLFVIIFATEERKGPLIVSAIALSSLVIILVSLSVRRDNPVSRLHLWFSAQNRSDPTDDYRAARRRMRAREHLGQIEPPTVETVRDAANHGNAWAPGSAVSTESQRGKK
jgi:CHASE2 domain-containing sensor protein